MKRVIIEFLIGLPIVIVGFFILDFLYMTFIEKTPFVFNVKSCGICIAVWAIVEAVTYFTRNRK